MKINAKKGLLAVLLSATTLTSCGSISEKNIKVSEIRNVLSTVDDLTEIDEQLETVKMEKYEQLSKNEFKDCSYDFKIEDLEKELARKELICDTEKCNDMLKSIIYKLIRTEIAEYLNVNYEDITGLCIKGTRFYTNTFSPAKSSFYTIEFTYKEKRYTALANNNNAFGLCFRYRSCEKKELDYYGIHECYNYIKGSMLCKAILSCKNEVIEGKTYEKNEPITYTFDVTLDLKKDKEKEEIVTEYIKQKKHK